MQPVVYLFQAANLAEQGLRDAIASRFKAELTVSGMPDINLTTLLVLHVLAAHSPGQAVRRGDPQSAAGIAQQLGCPRSRISMEMRQLLAREWVDAFGKSRTSRGYALTPRGLAAARTAREMLAEQSHAMHQINGKKMTLVRSLEYLSRGWAEGSSSP